MALHCCLANWVLQSYILHSLFYRGSISNRLVFKRVLREIRLSNADCTLMFASVVFKMVCELIVASLVYSYSFEIENARLRFENYTCRLGLHMQFCIFC